MKIRSRQGPLERATIHLADMVPPDVSLTGSEDVTERRLQLGAWGFRALLDRAPVAFAVTDQDGIFQTYEGRGLEGLGRKPGDLIGRSIFEEYAGRPDITEPYRMVLTGEVGEITVPVTTRGRDLLLHLAAITEKGHVTGTAVIYVDITSQREAAEIRAKLDTQAEFFASISHELRQPLNTILGFSQLLALHAKGMDETQLRYLDRMQTSGAHLMAIINDFLDLSKIQSGHLKLQPKRLRADEAAETALHTVAPLASAKGLDLRLALPKTHYLVADPIRVHQVLVNLLSNAVKATEKGWIGVSTKRKTHNTEITVADTGIGISQDDLDTIFDPFVQATHQSGGTGLGLAIVRRLLELMDGSITAESELGRGSSFRVRLPAG